jgi:hypothetical protein
VCLALLDRILISATLSSMKSLELISDENLPVEALEGAALEVARLASDLEEPHFMTVLPVEGRLERLNLAVHAKAVEIAIHRRLFTALIAGAIPLTFSSDIALITGSLVGIGIPTPVVSVGAIAMVYASIGFGAKAMLELCAQDGYDCRRSELGPWSYALREVTTSTGTTKAMLPAELSPDTTVFLG